MSTEKTNWGKSRRKRERRAGQEEARRTLFYGASLSLEKSVFIGASATTRLTNKNIPKIIKTIFFIIRVIEGYYKNISMLIRLVKRKIHNISSNSSYKLSDSVVGSTVGISKFKSSAGILCKSKKFVRFAGNKFSWL